MDTDFSTFAYLAGASVLHQGLRVLWRDKLPPSAERVGTVSCLNFYPVKSMRAIEVEEAMCTPRGLQVGPFYDRSWMVIQGERNQFISGRREPKLATIETSIHGNTIQLNAPGHNRLTLPIITENSKDRTQVHLRIRGSAVVGWDCGEEAAHWLSSVLGLPDYKLIQYEPSLPCRHPALISKTWPHMQLAKPEDQISYHDSSPFTLLTDASMADLNSRLTDMATFKQFRQTIEVASLNPAFDEDNWDEIYIGDAKFTNLGPVPRCKFTAVDPSTGVTHPHMEPKTTLMSYRQLDKDYKSLPAFGRSLVLNKPGEIHLGDPVYALRHSKQTDGL